MASKFSLSARLRVLPPTTANVQRAVKTIRNEIRSINARINVGVTNQSLRNLAKVEKTLSDTSKSADKATKSVDNFGHRIIVTGSRFAAFLTVSTGFVTIIRNLRSGTRAAIDFERELIRIEQVSGRAFSNVSILGTEARRLGIDLGVGASGLLKAARVLTQSGQSIDQVRRSLSALAKTELAPNFESLGSTTEGLIAIFSQFNVTARDSEKVLSQINAVASKYAVEAGDIITAVRKAGGAFSAAGGNFEEFLALFTAVRSTTRESADTIATGFRTIFSRLQRPTTIKFLDNLGIKLTELNGEFIGPFKAVQQLNRALSILGTEAGTVNFARIVEQLGGIRQVARVIPLIQQAGKAQQALSVAQRGANSLTEDATIAQRALSTELQKVREEFNRVADLMVNSTAFQTITRAALKFASAMIRVAEALEPIAGLFALAAGFTAAQVGVQALRAFSNSPALASLGFPGFAEGGSVGGRAGKDKVVARLTKGEFVVRKEAVDRIGARNLQALNTGKLPRFQTGGLVGGSVAGTATGIGAAATVLFALAGSMENLDGTMKELVSFAGEFALRFTVFNQLISTVGALSDEVRGNTQQQQQTSAGQEAVARAIATSDFIDRGVVTPGTQFNKSQLQKFTTEGLGRALILGGRTGQSSFPGPPASQRTFDFQSASADAILNDSRRRREAFQATRRSAGLSAAGRTQAVLNRSVRVTPELLAGLFSGGGVATPKLEFVDASGRSVSAETGAGLDRQIQAIQGNLFDKFDFSGPAPQPTPPSLPPSRDRERLFQSAQRRTQQRLEIFNPDEFRKAFDKVFDETSGGRKGFNLAAIRAEAARRGAFIPSGLSNEFASEEREAAVSFARREGARRRRNTIGSIGPSPLTRGIRRGQLIGRATIRDLRREITSVSDVFSKGNQKLAANFDRFQTGVALFAAAISAIGNRIAQSAELNIQKGADSVSQFAAGRGLSGLGQGAVFGFAAGSALGGPAGALLGTALGAATNGAYSFATGIQEGAAALRRSRFSISLEKAAESVRQFNSGQRTGGQFAARRIGTSILARQFDVRNAEDRQNLDAAISTNVPLLEEAVRQVADDLGTADEAISFFGTDVIRLVAQTRGITFNELKEELDTYAETQRNAREALERLRVALLQQADTGVALLSFQNAIRAASVSVEDFRGQLDIRSAFATGGVASITAPTARLTGGLGENRLRDILNVTSGFGAAGVRVGQRTASVSNLASQLPSILTGLAQSDGDIAENLSKIFETQFRDVPATIKEILLSNIQQEGFDLAKELAKDPRGTAQNLLGGDLPELEAIKSAESALADQLGGIIQTFDARRRSEEEIIGTLNNVVSIRGDRERTIAGLLNRDINFTSLRRGERIQQGNIVGAGNVGIANNPIALSSQLLASQNRILQLNNRLQEVEVTQRAALVAEIAKEQDQAARLKAGLDFLADATGRARLAQEELAKVQSDRIAKRDFATDIAFGDLKSRSTASLGIRAAIAAASSGDLRTIPDSLRDDVLQVLNAFSDVRLPGFGGETGGEVRDRLLFKFLRTAEGFSAEEAAAVVKGGDKETRLIESVDAAFARAEAAQTGLANVLQNQNSALLRDLGIQFTSFLTTLNQSLVRGEVESNNRAVQALQGDQAGLRGRAATLGRLQGLTPGLDLRVASNVASLQQNAANIQNAQKVINQSKAAQDLIDLGNRSKGDFRSTVLGRVDVEKRFGSGFLGGVVQRDQFADLSKLVERRITPLISDELQRGEVLQRFNAGLVQSANAFGNFGKVEADFVPNILARAIRETGKSSLSDVSSELTSSRNLLATQPASLVKNIDSIVSELQKLQTGDTFQSLASSFNQTATQIAQLQADTQRLLSGGAGSNFTSSADNLSQAMSTFPRNLTLGGTMNLNVNITGGSAGMSEAAEAIVQNAIRQELTRFVELNMPAIGTPKFGGN